MEGTNYFVDLFSINVNDKKEQKNRLDYLSWAFAWGELKKRHPKANSKVYENADGWNYFHDGKTAWVKVGVSVDELEHIEYLPVMNNANKSIPLKDITSFDVNKAIQRATTKAIARHGIGLYIYAGEDIPEGDEETPETQVPKTPPKIAPKKPESVPPAQHTAEVPKAENKPENGKDMTYTKGYVCEVCGEKVTNYLGDYSLGKLGHIACGKSCKEILDKTYGVQP